MKVTVIGSHLCPDTLYAIQKLKEADADLSFVNISAALADLKTFLAIRESDALYDEVRKNGGIGIPLFVMPRYGRTRARSPAPMDGFFRAAVGQTWTQSPQRMHSLSFGSRVGSQSILQTAAHLPQRTQASVSKRSR